MRLVLLGGFELRIKGRPVQLAASVQRVVAFVALHDRPVRRAYVAGSLWLDLPEERAAASLRSALWRIHRCCELIETAGEMLRLDPGVQVDLREAEALARRGLDGDAVDDLEVDASRLACDLLPGWYDDWVLIERERFRQLRLRSLDALCDRLSGAGRFGDALDVGLLSVAGERLRESAHRAVVRAHLADGNASEALRQYRLCEQLLREQLGIEPSERMRELIRGLDGLETER
ncbi:MAG TPA: BTAD domain-containing putative transcriptional regulator [Gaiellaceae bacterium]|nr:BTAD domain-containing putative transcriptional regulator [Gaiellaceae bacterium]